MYAWKFVFTTIALCIFGCVYFSLAAQEDVSRPAPQQAGTEGAGLSQPATPVSNDIDRDRLAFERQKHAEIIALERWKHEATIVLEKAKTQLTVISTMIPLLAVIATVGFGIWSQRQQAKLARQEREEEAQADFELKVAESMMAASGANDAANRAKMLKDIFQHRLRPDFLDQFEAGKYGRLGLSSSRIELMRIVAANQPHKAEIIELWKKVFPADEWAKAL